MNATEFLGALWGEKDDERGWIELASGVYDGKSLVGFGARHYRTAAEAGVAIETSLTLKQVPEIYVCVGLPKKKPKTRTSAADVCGVTGLFADLDFEKPGSGKSYPPDLPSVKQLLDSLGLPPTLLVHTGGGCQAWWLFTEIKYFDTDEERDHYRTVVRGWVEAITYAALSFGWEIDQAKDLARLLRVAGTFNGKYPGGARKVEVIQEGTRYEDTDPFCALIDETPKRASTTAVSVGGEWKAGDRPKKGDPALEDLQAKLQQVVDLGLVYKFDPEVRDSLLSCDKRFKKLWEYQETLYASDQSKYDAALVQVGLDAGMEDVVLAQMIAAHREKHGDEKGKAESAYYLAMTILSGKWFRGRKYALDECVADVDANPHLVDVDEENPEPTKADEAKKGLEVVRRETGLTGLVGVKQIGRNKASFYFRWDDGDGLVREIPIGGARILHNPKRLAERLYEYRIATFKGDLLTARGWKTVLKHLSNLTCFQEAPEKESIALFADLLAGYLEAKPAALNELEDRGEFARSLRPFVEDSRLYLSARDLWEHGTSNGHEMKLAAVHDLLRECKATRVTINVPAVGKRPASTRSFWWMERVGVPAAVMESVASVLNSQGASTW